MWRIGFERWRMRTRPTARSLSTVSAETPRRNPNRRVQGMGTDLKELRGDFFQEEVVSESRKKRAAF